MSVYKIIEEELNRFVGAKINGVRIDIQNEWLVLDTDKGDFNFHAVGDCCSHSWIEHLTGVKNVIGGTITEIPELCPDKQGDDNIIEEYEVERNYQTEIKTDKGSLYIEFRNSSNGFYGGYLTLGTDQYCEFLKVPSTSLVKDDV